MKVKEEVSAGGIVFRKESGKTLWLITQHSANYSWVFPKGLVGDHNPDEKMEVAALREVKEEGGIRAKIVNSKPWKTEYEYKFRGVLIKKTVYYYLMEYISGSPKDHDWEMRDAKFVTSTVALKALTYEKDRSILKQAIKVVEK